MIRMNGRNILSKILDTEITMIKDYETNSKPISILYNKFKDKYRLPINYFRYIKSNPEVNFYLTPEEKYEYLGSWLNKLSNEYIGFTKTEYDLYMIITLENQYYDIKKSGHYIDDGCICVDCKDKRNKYLEIVKNGMVKPDLNLVHIDNEFNLTHFYFSKLFLSKWRYNPNVI